MDERIVKYLNQRIIKYFISCNPFHPHLLLVVATVKILTGRDLWSNLVTFYRMRKANNWKKLQSHFHKHLKHLTWCLISCVCGRLAIKALPCWTWHSSSRKYPFTGRCLILISKPNFCLMKFKSAICCAGYQQEWIIMSFFLKKPFMYLKTQHNLHHPAPLPFNVSVRSSYLKSFSLSL